MARSPRPDRANGYKWGKVRELAWRRLPHVCAMPVCHAPSRVIDREAFKWPHPWSGVVDHIEPVSRRPDLVFVLANLRLAHKVCNEKLQPSVVRRPSVDW